MISLKWLRFQLINRYTADGIINCIYGLECNAFAEKSEVHSMLMRNFSPSIKRNVINAVLTTFPFIEKLYQQSFIPSELNRWFYDIMAHAIELRSIDSSVQRKDLLNFLFELRQTTGYTDDAIAAFAAIFFFDGYETTSTVLVQVLYHLAMNQRCQDKLRDEIKNWKEITPSDNVNDLEYLDSVVNGMWNVRSTKSLPMKMSLKNTKKKNTIFPIFNVETLRIAPSQFLQAKTCSEPIELHDYDGKSVKIETGTCIQLPLYAIHHDADYYPDPETFKPERFNAKSLQQLRDNGLFLPFGNGPRICMGKKN